MAVYVLSIAGLGSLYIPRFSYPALGIDLVKLSLKSPYTRIAWHLMPWTIQFDLCVRCSDEITTSNFLSPWISPVADAFPNHRIEVKLCCFCGFIVCILCCCVYVVVFVVIVFLFLFLFYPTLALVRFWAIMYVIFATLLVGFEVLLYINFGFLITFFSESFSLSWFQWSLFYS